MSKIIKNSIIIGILAIFLSTLIPSLTFAQSGRNIRFGPSEDDNSGPRVRSESPSSGVPYSNNPSNSSGTNTQTTYYVLSGPTSSSQSSDTRTTTKSVEQKEETKEDKNVTAKDLAANALFGSTGFLPSGLTQWIFLAVLILLLIIIVRKTLAKDKEFMDAPLKHH